VGQKDGWEGRTKKGNEKGVPEGVTVGEEGWKFKGGDLGGEDWCEM